MWKLLMGPKTADLQLVRCLILILLFCTAPSFALAQTFPSAPVKIVVPVTAGGAPDVVSRIVAEKLAAKLGQPVIVENRPGAGERIGAEFVAKGGTRRAHSAGSATGSARAGLASLFKAFV